MRPWSSLPVYTRLTVVGLLVLVVPAALALIANIIDSFNNAIPINVVAIIVPPVVAGVVWRYQKWALVAAVVVALLSLVVNGSVAQYGRNTPSAFFDFVPTVFMLVGFIMVIFGAVGSFLQRKQDDPRTSVTSTEWGTLGVVSVVVLVLSIWSGVATITGGSTVAAEDKIGATDLLMKQVKFLPDRLEIAAESPARMVIDNDDLIIHTFTIEDLDIEHVLGPKDEILVRLPALSPGEYAYTCQVPGHESMKGVLVVQ